MQNLSDVAWALKQDKFLLARTPDTLILCGGLTNGYFFHVHVFLSCAGGTVLAQGLEIPL